MSEKLLTVIERETGQIVTEETPLDDLGVDSLEFMDLVLMLANETGKDVPDAKLGEMQTVGDLLREFA